EGETVDQARAMAVGLGKRRRKLQRGLAFPPQAAAARAVLRDALAHLGVERLGGCDIDGLSREGAGARFRPRAFARSGAPSDENDGHDLSTSRPCTNHQMQS